MIDKLDRGVELIWAELSLDPNKQVVPAHPPRKGSFGQLRNSVCSVCLPRSPPQVQLAVRPTTTTALNLSLMLCWQYACSAKVKAWPTAVVQMQPVTTRDNNPDVELWPLWWRYLEPDIQNQGLTDVGCLFHCVCLGSRGKEQTNNPLLAPQIWA